MGAKRLTTATETKFQLGMLPWALTPALRLTENYPEPSEFFLFFVVVV